MSGERSVVPFDWGDIPANFNLNPSTQEDLRGAGDGMCRTQIGSPGWTSEPSQLPDNPGNQGPAKVSGGDG